ncbi:MULTISPECIES: glutathione-disulfide reductase [Novosphingobium]|uniref:glutathione-disulfide reductase n=1 Tax=Novosphingobium TaxID=165696 RepID=UPI000788551D|nr:MULTISPECIES: glutathione-disulfide reductase [Novosphingobium]MBB3357732.1 glutathione reductase (NADPH) [Novosphingobium sp. BK256]MBB3373604.1 glutathione reductase (NADPH) [Novosphingobium sp. BK280]MBB3378016.1 glutathione reductase (NADPH) [Novosphingobium sp. BK258]MBB3420199.1 glutathione reductase (NADPH) [Novosphingobium sp. BK267]MBB3447479.1 glutathione reductase (NADPH) [Novosphingobium sp. BK352]
MTEPAYDYDLFVIGAGSGGVRASRIAAGYGARVAVAEEYRVGGTCVIRGCVPKKLLVYGSHFAEELQDAANYGWTVEKMTFDWPTLRDAVAKDVDRLNAAYTNTLNSNKVEHFLERATITGPNSVKLASGREISARYILVAVGAWPVMPPFEGAEHCITSNEVFSLEKLPRRVVIAGAGYIALEFAGIFNALGSHVTVVNRSETILRGYDAALRDRLLQITMARGIEYKFNCGIERVERLEDGCLNVHMKGQPDPLGADAVLVATGRRPKTDGLGLENAGIELGEHGEIRVDDTAQTSCPSIFAVGDVTNRVQLTPIAIREGHAFADRVFGGKDTRVAYDCIPSAVFSQPPLASVGLTEAQAREMLGSNVKVFTSDFRPMKNIFAHRHERGLYKLVVDAQTDKVLGVHLIGPEAPEVLQAAAIAVKAGLTKADFDATVALHPSMAEELVLMR